MDRPNVVVQNLFAPRLRLHRGEGVTTMRFPADDIWKVRSGEQTRLTIPHERKPCPFKEAGYYVLEREVDVAETRPCLVCAETGKRKDGSRCKRCGGFGKRVHYLTRVERVDGDERLQVLTREKVRPEELTDAQALEEGWESAAEWRDAFFATHGEVEWVWTITFELTTQVPQYMARQHGIVDAPQYVSTPERAIDDADAPTAGEYRAWAETAEAKARANREARRLEDRARALQEKAEQLRRKAA